MKKTFVIACCLCVCSVAALGEKKPTKRPASSVQNFINFAAQTDMVEAHLGQIAQTAAASEQVKNYAQMLVTDQTSDFNQLSSVARQIGLIVPRAIDREHDKTIVDPVEKLQGATFDHRYIEDIIAGHERGIAIFRKEEKEARDPALKSYADHALPILEKHLAAAIKLEKTRS
jgi:putative membrane protein